MALITDLGVDGGGIAQPKIKNRWALTFQNMAGDSEPLRLNAITAERPKLEFEQITLDRYNSRAYVLGKHQFDPITITFEDDFNGGVVAALQAQLELQQNIIGVNSAPRLPAAAAGQDYKFAIRMDLLDGNIQVLETFVMEGCMVTNIDYDMGDYAASETIKVTTTFRFDHARQNVNRDNKNATGGAGSVGSNFVI